MALNSCKMWSNGTKIAFFQKLTKIAQPLAVVRLSTAGLHPQTPVCDTFEYTSLLNTSSKLYIYTF